MFGNFLFSKFFGNSIDEITDGRGFEPLLFHFQADFQWQRPFSEGCAGLVESQRLFSDEQLAVIKNACEFALEDDATLSYAEEKQLHSVQEQIELLLPQQERNQHPTMEQTM